MLTATLQPALRLLPLDEIDQYLSGQHPRPQLTPAGVLDELQRRHAYAMLVRDGTRPKTSRRPGQLRCALRVTGVPRLARPGDTFTVTAEARNTSDTQWLAQPSRRGGYITFGCKLLAEDGRLVSDRLGRTALSTDVAPGERASARVSIDLPGSLPPGTYRLAFDLVDELVCWFSDLRADSCSVHTLTVKSP